MNILICYMHESELQTQSYGVMNMSTWTENIRDLEKIQPPRSRVTVHAREPRTPARRRRLRRARRKAAGRRGRGGSGHSRPDLAAEVAAAAGGASGGVGERAPARARAQGGDGRRWRRGGGASVAREVAARADRRRRGRIGPRGPAPGSPARGGGEVAGATWRLRSGCGRRSGRVWTVRTCPAAAEEKSRVSGRKEIRISGGV